MFLIIVPILAAYSQLSTRVASVSPAEASTDTPLTVTAHLRQGQSVERAYFAYRIFGEGEYTKVEMDLVGNAATVTLAPSELAPPVLEYYLILTDKAGSVETYPMGEISDPFSVPPARTQQIRLRPSRDQDMQVIFLSPEPFSRLPVGEVLISVSLFRTDTTAVRRATRLLLDGVDISNRVVFSGDIIVYAPENHSPGLSPGPHKVTVLLFNRHGTLHRSASLQFTVTGQDLGVEPVSPAFQYGASVQMQSRHEQVGGTGTWFNRGTIHLDGGTADWQFTGKLFLTSDETTNRQPQHRYSLGAESPWLTVGYGDMYPLFPSLILNGKRVRGLNSSLRLSTFRLDVAIGQTNRAIEGKLLKIIGVDTLAAEQQRDPFAAYRQIDTVSWGKFRYGTYSRTLLAVRPSWGDVQSEQLGLTVLKSKDEPQSIQYGIRPQENLVLGIDFLKKFDERRIELSVQGAFSAFNNDISSGSFTDKYIDSVYTSNANEIKVARDILKNFITVNENIRPLSLKKLSTAALESSLGLNYFDHSLKIAYVYRGSDYTSFGQTFLRTDIRGFNVGDRVRFLDNQLLLAVNYERLQDNTSNLKPATTVFSNINFAASYYAPERLPTVTAGFGHFSRSNGLSVFSADSQSVVNDRTNHFFLQSTYDVDFGGTRYTTLLNLSVSDRDDRSLGRFDVNNIAFSLGLSTQSRIPLQTSIVAMINTNTLPGTSGRSQDLHYMTLSFNIRYSHWNDRLILMSTVSPTVGDIQRIVIATGFEYVLQQGMNIGLQFSFLGNQSASNESILDLTYRYEL